MAGRPPARWLLSRQAQRDLDSVWRYIAVHGSPKRADGMLDRLLRRFLSLAEQPFSGRPRTDLRPGWRSATVDPFVIYYRVTPAGIRILRVWHSRRDQDRLRRDP